MAKSIDGLSRQPKKDTTTPEVVEETTSTPKATADSQPVKETEKTPTEASAEEVTEPAEPPKEEEVAVEETPKEETAEAKPESTPEKTTEPEKTGEPEAAAAETAPTDSTTPATPGKTDGFDLFPEPSVVVSGPPTWLWWLLLVAGAAALGFLAFDLTRGRIDSWLASDTPTPSPSASASVSSEATPTPSASTEPTPTPTPTPSESPEVDKSKVTLRVLNGTTQAGAAAATKIKLEAAGFTVKSIGNANNQNYTKSYVYYQAGRKAEGEAVLAALADPAAVLEESTLANPDMVLVVFGK